MDHHLFHVHLPVQACDWLDCCTRLQVPSAAAVLLRADDTQYPYGLCNPTVPNAHHLDATDAAHKEAGYCYGLPCRLFVCHMSSTLMIQVAD